MSKKLKNLKWESVALEGFPVSMSDKFQSFVGLEECTNYGLDKEAKQSKNKKQKQIPKRKSNETIQAVPIKKSKLNNQIKTENKEKVKLSNGFIVESCELATPSLTNTVSEQVKSKKKRKNEKKDKKKKPQANIEINVTKTKNKTLLKKKKKLGDDITNVVSHLTPEDMLTWAEFKLQEPIMKALTELGFKKPTKIQELTLPAAIHGRRDILGAAETGSGKTLAFGLPILSGILKLKEKAELGLDVYELPYKKTSNKKRKQEDVKVKNVKCEMLNGKKKVEHKAKESSEDGYGSDDESGNASDEETTIHNVKTKSMKNGIKVVKTKDIKKSAKKDKTKLNCEDDFIEEIEVPIRRRETSIDEGNDSDDSENYIHLSELLVSDDSADSNDDHEKEGEFETKQTRIDNDSDTESALGDDDEEAVDCVESVDNEEDCNEDNSEDCGDDDNSGENSDEQELTEDVDEENQGIGCVKVIDDVEMPGPVMVKTGKPLFALILTPTRELAIQISRHLIAVAKYTGIRVATIVGGMAAVKQERVLRSGPEIVVATPGRLWELVTQGQQHLQQLDCIKFLAIDETDRMLERGHFDELQPLLERLNADEGRRSTRQNFVFSATLTMVHELPAHMRGKKVTKRGKIINRKIEKMTPEQKIKKLINKLGMTDPKVVDITTQNLGTAETLTESRIACSLQHKDAYLYYILKRHPGRTIVFCNSIGSVKRLAQLFTILKCRPLPLHASMPQRQRLKNLERFRDDPNGVLVATDVAARGLDIPNVDHVIHYQVPRTAENYVHRSGRTARATKEGLTILLMEPAEAFLYGKLCRTLNKTSEVPTFPVPPQSLSPLKELVSLARDLDSLMLKRRRSAQSVGWREKAAREMDMIIDDDDLPVKEVDPTIDKALQIKKRQLEAMLVRPLFPKGFSFKYPTLNDPAMFVPIEENALQVMKRSLESGELKKEKRKSKNAPLLKLEKK